jgi:hypothetical protein
MAVQEAAAVGRMRDDLVASAVYRAAAMAEIWIPSALPAVSAGGTILGRHP